MGHITVLPIETCRSIDEHKIALAGCLEMKVRVILAKSLEITPTTIVEFEALFHLLNMGLCSTSYVE